MRIDTERAYQSDNYIYFKSLGAIAVSYWKLGESTKLFKTGKELLEYGQKHGNIRCQTMGHMVLGGAYNLAGDLQEFINSFQDALDVSADIMYNK
jgi:2-phospho-L-lactate transferase/gluconeogenesis factor (CofD/UPF0052 family)